MNVWVVYTYEPIQEVDSTFDRYRYGELCRALLAAGHKVVWWQSTFNHITKQHRAHANTTKEISNHFQIIMLHGRGYKRNVTIDRVLHNHDVASQLRSAMREMGNAPDIVIAGLPSLECAEVSSDYCHERGIPFVLDAHDQWPEVYLQVVPRILRPLFRVMLLSEFRRAAKIARRASAWTAVSESYLDWVATIGNRPRSPLDKVFELGSGGALLGQAAAGWQELKERHRIPENKTICAFIGTFGRSYDLNTLVEAARLENKAPSRLGLHFLLIGGGDRFDEIRRLTQGLNNITLLGRVRQLDLSIIMKNVAIGISAYSSAATQSLPYKPFEYMAAGLPQVSSLGGELARILQRTRTGVYYQAGNAADLLEKLVRLARNEGLRKYMGQRARQIYLNRYSMDEIYPKMVKHLEAVRENFDCGISKHFKMLYVHQYFGTRAGSAGTRSYEFARRLAQRGHSITVVTGVTDLSDIETLAAGRTEFALEGIRVLVVPVKYSNNQRVFRRTLVFTEFCLRAMSLCVREKFDVVYATSTPLTVGLVGAFAKTFGRAKTFVFEVRDLWPDIPRALGVRSRPLLYVMKIMESLTYCSADACVGLSPGILSALKLRTSKEVKLLPNAADLEFFKPSLEAATCEREFTAVYAGAHGVANGLECVLDAAEELKKAGHRNIQILFIGDGSERASLIEQAYKRNLDNCKFYVKLPKTEVAHILSRASCGLMIFKNIPEFYYGTSPNKFFDYIASGLPVVINYPGWMAQMISASNCGIVVPPERPALLAEALCELAKNSTFRSNLGINARALAEERFGRDAVTDQLEFYLQRYTSRERRIKDSGCI